MHALPYPPSVYKAFVEHLDLLCQCRASSVEYRNVENPQDAIRFNTSIELELVVIAAMHA